ncbi:MAG: hypothetical protein ACI9DJ_002501 [Algoriphagus sp.]|jgi:hypothetical protein
MNCPNGIAPMELPQWNCPNGIALIYAMKSVDIRKQRHNDIVAAR